MRCGGVSALSSGSPSQPERGQSGLVMRLLLSVACFGANRFGAFAAATAAAQQAEIVCVLGPAGDHTPTSSGLRAHAQLERWHRSHGAQVCMAAPDWECRARKCCGTVMRDVHDSMCVVWRRDSMEGTARTAFVSQGVASLNLGGTHGHSVGSCGRGSSSRVEHAHKRLCSHCPVSCAARLHAAA